MLDSAELFIKGMMLSVFGFAVIIIIVQMFSKTGE